MKRMENGNNSLSDLIGTPEENENNDTNMQQIAKDQVDAFFAGMGRPQPVTESKPSESITIQQVSQEEFEQGTVITAQHIKQEAMAKIDEQKKEDMNNVLSTLKKSTDEEDRRLKALDDKGAEVYQAFASGEAVRSKDGETVEIKHDQDDLRRYSGDPDYKVIPNEDLTPVFDEDDDFEPDSEEPKADDAEDLDTEEGINHVLATSPSITYADDKSDVIKVLRKKHMRAELVSTGRFESKTLADQAFMNNAAKFKAKNFRTVRVPLANSGFSIDMVGTGANDLIMLYDNTDQRINAADYELNRMRTMMKSIVGSDPKVAPGDMKNLIHHRDYVMMSYAHLCATLDEVVFPHTCPKCNHTFKIKANPADMLLNVDELRPIIEKINVAKDPRENSLMAAEVKMEFDSGFEVVVGHPSYYDEVVMLNALNHYLQNLQPIEATPLGHMANTLLYIRRITLPNGLRAANVYQTFQALRLMDLNEFDQVRDAVKEIMDQVKEIKIGVHDVVCPHCKETIPEIGIDNVSDLIFFLTMVTSAEKEAMTKSQKTGSSK